jgi:DNA-binding Xre family transcriptional regulator
MLKGGVKKLEKNVELTELKAILRFKNISYRELSREIDMSIGTLSDKLNNRNGRTFSITEIKKICDYVGIMPNEIPKYFF